MKVEAIKVNELEDIYECSNCGEYLEDYFSYCPVCGGEIAHT